MLLKEILEEADLLVSNALSVKQKLRFYNQVQRALYRDIPTTLRVSSFVTQPGISLYELAVPEERVKQVTVGGLEHSYQLAEDHNVGRVYSFFDGKLFIQPTPTESQTANVIYQEVPVDVTENDLDREGTFLADFPNVFIYGVAQKLAMVNKDYQTATEFELRYRSVVEDAIMKNNKGKIKGIRRVRRWS